MLAVAAGVSLLGFTLLLVLGRHHASSNSQTLAPAQLPAPAPMATAVSPTPAGPPAAEPANDIWIQPLAGPERRVTPHDRRLFAQAREGIPADQCRGGRCAVDIEANAGAVVMAVHDGVIEAVERGIDAAHQRGQEGRFLRINHNGGTVVSSYMQLDGIREDLRPGVPVKVGEPIGTVGRSSDARPHLRFAVSFRNTADGPEMFVDPQPMLILWPLRARAFGTLHGMERASATSD